MDSENQTTIEYPSLTRRFQSLFIDQVFIVLCMVIISQILANTDTESTGGLRGFLFFALFFVYEPFCIAFGCSVGISLQE